MREAAGIVDASGQLADGSPVDGPAALRKAILKHPEQFVRTMTEKMLTYALGRGLEYYDLPTVRSIARDAASQNNRFSSLVLGIVRSTPFQMKLKAPRGCRSSHSVISSSSSCFHRSMSKSTNDDQMTK